MALEGQRLMSRTQHYRKVTKPLLERKRRARMNFYLDKLKDLIVDTMEAQGNHVTKLEKADILEMTVDYLKTKKNTEQNQLEIPLVDPEKFEAGYSQAAYEVSKVFSSFPGFDLKFGRKLMNHLGYQLKDMRLILKPSSSESYHHEGLIALVDNTVQQPSLDFVDLFQEKKRHEELDLWRPW